MELWTYVPRALSHQRWPVLRVIAHPLDLAIKHSLRNLVCEKRLVRPHGIDSAIKSRIASDFRHNLSRLNPALAELRLANRAPKESEFSFGSPPQNLSRRSSPSFRHADVQQRYIRLKQENFSTLPSRPRFPTTDHPTATQQVSESNVQFRGRQPEKAQRNHRSPHNFPHPKPVGLHELFIHTALLERIAQ